MTIFGLTVGELIALLTFFGTVFGLVVRYGIVLPLKGLFKPLQISIDSLSEQMKESREDRQSIRSGLNDHEKRITVLEVKDEGGNKIEKY